MRSSYGLYQPDDDNNEVSDDDGDDDVINEGQHEASLKSQVDARGFMFIHTINAVFNEVHKH